MSVYIGGGTPTTLSAQQLQRLIVEIKTNFDLSKCIEFTVEAGRADTITKEKLEVLNNNHISRISINPQSLNDEVLKVIGRNHSVNDFLECFKMAKNFSFESINMDIIAGLDADTFYSFKNTVDRIIELAPENITVHTLSAKKGASKADRLENTKKHEIVGDMLEYANKTLIKAGYFPYYIYRQKSMRWLPHASP